MIIKEKDHIHVVFVYGTLKKDCDLNHIMDPSTYLGKAVTKDKYKLHNINGLPMLEKGIEENYIEGEVYVVNDEILKTLDVLEGIPNFYQRESIFVMLGDVDLIYTYVYFITEKALKTEKCISLLKKH